MTAFLIGLGVLAFGLLVWKLVIPQWVEDIRQLKAYSKELGLLRTALVFVALFAFIGCWLWLDATVRGWPEEYGSTCQGRGCWFDTIAASPGLLAGGWREWLLFAFIWSMPAVIVGSLVYAFIMKRGIFSRNNIRSN